MIALARLALIATALFVTAGGAYADPDLTKERSLRIESCEVTLDVDAGGRVEVEEVLRVRFKGSWNGIYRTLPIRAGDGSVARRPLRLSDFEVLQGGEPLEFHADSTKDWVRLRIRVPDAEDTTHEITIRYRAKDVVRRAGEVDRLYWNAIGAESDVRVDTAKVTVRLPETLPAASVTTAAYRGPLGSGTTVPVGTATEGAFVASIEGLAPRQGLTVLLSFPAGYVSLPEWGERIGWILLPHAPAAIPAFLLLLMLAWWFFRGRDQIDPGRVVPTDRVPEGLSPAEAGVLIDDHLDPRDVVAEFVALAVRGALTFRLDKEEHGPVTFVRGLSPSEEAKLPHHEQALLRILFPDNETRETTPCPASKPVRDALLGIREKLQDSLITKGLYTERPREVTSRWRYAIGMLTFLVLAAGFVMGFTFLFPVTLVVCVIAAWRLARVMPSCTRLGLTTLAALKGLEHYIQSATAESMKAKPIEHFQEVLPFSIALGVHETWLAAFPEQRSSALEWFVKQTDGETENPESVSAAVAWIGGAVAPWVLVPRFATSPHTPGGAGLGTTTFSGGSFGGGSVGGGFGGGSVGGW